MKKLALAALALFALTPPAYAVNGAVSQHINQIQVKFRSQVAANPSSVWDSVVTRRVGAAGASSVLDTTAAISTLGWSVPQNHALTDTSGMFCTLIVYDAPGTDDQCESGADSLSVAVQVSADMETWTTLSAITGQAGGTTNPITSRNDQTIAAGSFHGRLSSNGASLAAGQPIWNFTFKLRAVGGLAITDPNAISRFPFIRFILSFHDAKGYKVAAKVIHMRADEL